MMAEEDQIDVAVEDTLGENIRDFCILMNLRRSACEYFTQYFNLPL